MRQASHIELWPWCEQRLQSGVNGQDCDQPASLLLLSVPTNPWWAWWCFPIGHQFISVQSGLHSSIQVSARQCWLVHYLYVIIHNRKEKHIDYNKKSCVFLNKKKTTIIGYERVVYKFLDNHGHKSCKKNTKFFSKSECLLVFKIDYYQKRQGYVPGIKYLTTDRWSEAWFNETDSVRYFDKVGQEVLDHCYARSVQTNISLDRW